jgi:hypothetical protein
VAINTKFELPGQIGELHPCRYVELVVDAVQMKLDGARRYAERLADFPGAQTESRKA